jgi:hypothetical protein
MSRPFRLSAIAVQNGRRAFCAALEEQDPIILGHNVVLQRFEFCAILCQRTAK